MKTPKSVLYIAITLDGFIAKPYVGLNFLSIIEKLGKNYCYSEFLKTVYTDILRRKTYAFMIKKMKNLAIPNNIFLLSQIVK